VRRLNHPMRLGTSPDGCQDDRQLYVPHRRTSSPFLRES
jgi:hypothetical protein